MLHVAGSPPPAFCTADYFDAEARERALSQSAASAARPVAYTAYDLIPEPDDAA